jgi:TonB family protein
MEKFVMRFSRLVFALVVISTFCITPSLFAVEKQKDDSTLAVRKQEQKKPEDGIAATKLATIDSSDCPEMYSPEKLLPDSSGVFEKMPEMLSHQSPEFPRSAKKAGLIGCVWIKCLVSEEGDVLCVRVEKSSGSPALNQAAMDAAWNSKYRPAIQKGRPVRVWVSYPIEFKLN